MCPAAIVGTAHHRMLDLPPCTMPKTTVYGMPSESTGTRGYSVPNLGGVFGM